MDIKTEILSILSPIFGENVKKIIEENYDSKKPFELVELAYHMLSGYMGEKNADKLLENLLNKFPKIKVGVIQYEKTH
jgi:hypothetical protein